MVYIILGKGFEEIEAIAPYDILKRGGIDVQFSGIGGNAVAGSHGIVVTTESRIEDIGEAELRDAEMIVVPGGLVGVNNILASEAAMKAVKTVYDAGGIAAAICAGPMVLASLGILSGRNAVCYPGLEDKMTGANMTQETSTVVDGSVITARGPGAAIDFGLKLLEELKGPEKAREVAADMHYGQ